MTTFETGDPVIIVLHTPREKLIGLVGEINAAGIFVRAIELGYFEDWSRAIASGEPFLQMNDYFFPMWRVERITRDEPGGDIPSMSEQFLERTGRELAEF
jgi:hypothetical protein